MKMQEKQMIIASPCDFSLGFHTAAFTVLQR